MIINFCSQLDFLPLRQLNFFDSCFLYTRLVFISYTVVHVFKTIWESISFEMFLRIFRIFFGQEFFSILQLSFHQNSPIRMNFFSNKWQFTLILLLFTTVFAMKVRRRQKTLSLTNSGQSLIGIFSFIGINSKTTLVILYVITLCLEPYLLEQFQIRSLIALCFQVYGNHYS